MTAHFIVAKLLLTVRLLIFIVNHTHHTGTVTSLLLLTTSIYYVWLRFVDLFSTNIYYDDADDVDMLSHIPDSYLNFRRV